MNRQEAEDYIYSSYLRAERFQSYDSKDAEKRNPRLTKEIIDSLNHTPCISITGSKGKGSVANMISRILQTQHRVGLMTSPHIEFFNERFQVNNTPISDKEFVNIIMALKEPFDRIESSLPNNVCISPMGIQAAIGLSYFNLNKTTFNVFELGKGAKYDDVNNIENDYSVINTIFLEHTRELGDTIEKIAEDKSCIIKKGQKGVYVAEQQPEVINVITKKAESLNVPLFIYGRDFRAENIRYTDEGMKFDVVIANDCYENISVPLLGEHQAKNCALALAVCKSILSDWDMGAISSNLAQLEWPGRMEIVSRKPFIILDACINRGSTVNVKNVLSHLNLNSCVFIVGIPDDKDYKGVVLSICNFAKKIILTKSQNPHYHFSKIQGDTLTQNGVEVTSSNSVSEAISKAIVFNLPIVILGTTSVIADTKRYFHENKVQGL